MIGRKLVVGVFFGSILLACSGASPSDLFGDPPPSGGPAASSSTVGSSVQPSPTDTPAPSATAIPTAEPSEPTEPTEPSEPPPPQDASTPLQDADASRPDGSTGRDAACAPMASVCPAGWSYSNDGTRHRCSVGFTPPTGVGAYCAYSDQGYLGYYWPLQVAHTCAPGARYAPSTVGYCLWEGVSVPTNATVDCSAVSTGKLQFSWPCS